MLRRSFREEYDEVICEKQSQIVNSSIDSQYIGDAFDNKESRPKSSYHSKVEIKEQIFRDESSLSINYWSWIKKVNQNICMLINFQKMCSDLLNFLKTVKYLDFEL